MTKTARKLYPDRCPDHGDAPAPLRQCKFCKALKQRLYNQRKMARARGEKVAILFLAREYGAARMNWPSPELLLGFQTEIR